ncbi:hypothetical protein H5410_030051 [Solanum commersonii]|uniref:Uncharacterized protein n=1 Tax=Solanum commersonii TaxID=4109 RepID=A0A9J5YEI9_SOLCO|nr:hypothetical protein H5410_030051 [Solanum commersonii]
MPAYLLSTMTPWLECSRKYINFLLNVSGIIDQGRKANTGWPEILSAHKRMEENLYKPVELIHVEKILKKASSGFSRRKK